MKVLWAVVQRCSVKKGVLSSIYNACNCLEWHTLETATIGVLCNKMFLEISQNSQENTCVGVSGTGVFLWILQTPMVAASKVCHSRQLQTF